ncbi:DUF192 domain-containing protein [Phaeovulum vinaykumarii]|uniref:DUF192 domain-containing protein n=1 Tax=Phaeovulum vinaykumarii TaxID=407234 RepID=A0A1N7MG05_9RHOB|nr:DUF192 domain-containing protein [Phaeovulum vinaykumarii]SIS84921.1 hypothetical protein SAMN05421795_10767 [Phaeovulum vinaykumarii]SOC12005.1 hypothetical protein SAMN05878426_10767 [Phaeovulum vinaykumarii]
MPEAGPIRSFRGVVAAGLFLALAGCAAAEIPAPVGASVPVCRDDLALLQGGDGRWHRFRIELADTAADRARGLMFRRDLARDQGMLFVYPAPQNVAFWMRNTLIPLDMLFFDAAGRITRIHENARPLDETPIPGGSAVRFVLEIPGGQARAQGLRVGDRLAHPAVTPAQAALPCPPAGSAPAP